MSAMVTKHMKHFLSSCVIYRTEFEGSRLVLGIRKVKEASTAELPISDISTCQIDKLVRGMSHLPNSERT